MKKKFFNLVYLMTGTCILVLLSMSVTSNFMKDARIFGESVVITVEQPNPNKQIDDYDNINNEEEFKTVTYKRTIDKEIPKSTSIPKIISIEVVNYTGISKLSDEIKTTLEASGYIVTTQNITSVEPIFTAIIENNEKKAGSNIQKIIKAGKITTVL